MAAQLGDAMSGGEQDLSALVLTLRPGSYHRSRGAQRLRKRLRILIIKAMSVLYRATTRGTWEEEHYLVRGSRVEDSE